MGCTSKRSCLAISPGELQHKIVLQTLAEVSDSQGGFTSSWSTFATVWAAINPVKNWENPISMQNETRSSHKITIRYLSGLNNKMRIKFGNRYFNINSIINREEANVILDLMATEGMAT